MNPKSLKIAELVKTIDGGLSMNKPMISKSLPKSISENSKLVAEQAARISKSLPKTNFAELTAPAIGKLTLGNTCTH